MDLKQFPRQRATAQEGGAVAHRKASREMSAVDPESLAHQLALS
jgi:hypothetical protein